MGWLYMPSQGSSPLDTIRAYLAPDELVSASHDRYENAYYLAVRFARGDFRGRVGGVVALYEERNDGAEIGVKLIAGCADAGRQALPQGVGLCGLGKGLAG